MPFEIYRNDYELKDGAESVKVAYINDKKTTIYNLTPEQWSVSDKTLTFTLPVEPEDNDIIKVALAENAIYDVCGNGNMEFLADEVAWKYSKYKATKEDILGTFNYYLTLKSDGKTYKLGTFTISEYTGEDAEPGDVVIKNLYLDDSEIYGYYDLEAQKLYIYRYQALGTYVDKNDGETYGVVTYSLGGTSTSPFDLTADGIISTDFTLAYTDAAIENLLGFELPEGTTTFVKAAASSKAQKVGPILEMHFVDTDGHFLTNVSNLSTTSAKANDYIQQILRTMKMRPSSEDIQRLLEEDMESKYDENDRQDLNYRKPR
jgi:hypothetical protein